MSKPAKKGLVILGFDITGLGKNIFGGVHVAGKALASAFGAGGAANSLEKMETGAGLLPSWAQSSKGAMGTPVSAPDFVIIVFNDLSKKAAVLAPSNAIVTGGTRIDGNGYKSGEGFGQHFSFGYNAPTKVDVVIANQPESFTDVKQVLFCGGTEGAQTGGNSVAQSAADTGAGVVALALTSKGKATAPTAKPTTAVKGLDAAEILGAQIIGELEYSLVRDQTVGMSALDVFENIFTGGAVYTSEAARKGLFGSGGSGTGQGAYNVAASKIPYARGNASPAAAQALATAQQRLAQVRQAKAAATQAATAALLQQAAASNTSANAVSSSTNSTPASSSVVSSPSSAQPLSTTSTDDSTSDGSGDGSSDGSGTTNDVVTGYERSADMAKGINYEVLGKKIVGELQRKNRGHKVIGTEGEFGEPYTTEIIGATSTSAYVRGADLLGAAPPPRMTAMPSARPSGVTTAGITIKAAPGTNRTFPVMHLAPPANGKSAHSPATSIANARTAGNRAIQVAQKMQTVIKQLGAKKVLGIGIGNDGDGWVDIVGVAAPVRVTRKVTPMTPAQLKAIADSTTKVGKDVLTAADKHEKLIKTYTTKQTAAVKKIQALTNPNKSIGIKGDDVLGIDYRIIDADANFEILGAAYIRALDEAVLSSHVVGQAYYPPTSYPTTGIDPTTGYPYPTGSSYGSTGIDPSTGMPYSSEGYGTGAIDPTTGLPMDGSSTLAGPPDYGMGPAPTTAPALVPGSDYTPDPGFTTDYQVYSSTGSGVPVPVGAVIYQDDGSHPFQAKAIGSYGYFHQGVPSVKSRDGNGSGYIVRGVNKDGSLKWKAYIKSASVNNDQSLKADEAQSLPTMAQNSTTNGWGPLIGNPASWSKGLRYDVGADKWFWFYDQAPPWATAADTMNRMNQAVLDYKAQLTAAAANYAAEQAQDQLDAQNAAAMAKQQAQEDSDAQHQADLASIQAQAAQPALDQQNQQAQMQMMQQAQQAQIQMAQQQAQMQMQQQQMDQQSQQAQVQFMQQNPQLFAQMQMAQQQDPNQGQDPSQGGYGGQPSDQGGYGGGYAQGGTDVENGVDWGSDDDRGREDRQADDSSMDDDF